MAREFKPATRTQKRLRRVIDGAAGSGKTYTTLRLAHDLGKKVFVIDTQYSSGGIVDENGWNQVRKVEWKPIRREGIDYEFDLGFSMDMTSNATVTKTHSRLFPNEMEIPKPGKETAERILQWLSRAPGKPEIIPPIEI
ncbi:MAG: hypothetical protein Q4D62_05350 [Planctomycetia bacterium]|nr:hypothetical protein [Planctomycetia bacterium]